MRSYQNSTLDEIRNIAVDLDYEIIDTFLFNKRKKTATFLVQSRNDQNKRVLKCCSTKAPAEERKRFENELNFYRNSVDFKLAPKCFSIGDSHLVLNYIKSETLRVKIIRYLKNSDKKKEDLKHFFGETSGIVIDSLAKINSHEKGKVKLSYATEKYVQLFKNLSNSGPYSTKKNIMARILNKILVILSLGVVKSEVKRILSENETLRSIGFTHNDLHLDNIIVDSNGQAYIIDYALYEESDCYIFDIVYFLTTMKTLFSFKKETEEIYNEMIHTVLSKNKLPKKGVLELISLMSKSSVINSRFNSLSSKYTLFKNYLNYIKYFLYEFKR